MLIRNIRKKRGLTQEELAKKIGVNRATLSKYESGIIEPSIAQLKKIADVLGVHFASLLPEDVLKEYYERNLDLFAVDIQHSLADDAISEEDYEAYKKAIATTPEDIENSLLDEIINRKSRQRLISAYSKLNSEGQAKAIEFVEILTGNPEYLKLATTADPRRDETGSEGQNAPQTKKPPESE